MDEQRKHDGTLKDRVCAPYCEQHIATVTDLAVIKNSLLKIETAITTSTSFKSGVVVAFISIAFGFMIQFSAAVYFYGRLAERVDRNTSILTKLVETHQER
jgi:hypothetical protein